MKIQPKFILIFLFLILFGCEACSGSSQHQPALGLTGDEPGLSASEAIGIARQHCLSPDISPSEERAAEQIRILETGLNNSIRWEASYRGGGKWNVILHVPPANNSHGFNYQWTVFEKNLNAVFIEESKVSTNAGN
jgi:hypothetical protein